MRQKIVQIISSPGKYDAYRILGLDELGGVWRAKEGAWVELVSAIAEKTPRHGRPGEITLPDDHSREMAARLIEAKDAEIDRLNKIIYGSEK